MLTLLATLSGCQSGSGADPSASPAASGSPPASAIPPAASASEPPLHNGTPPTLTTAEVPEIIGASQILIAYKGAELAPPTVTRSRDDAQKRATEALTQLEQGKTSFEDLARTWSDDTSKTVNGAMGNFKRGVFPPALDDAAFKLKVGETSGLVETPRGFHILRRSR
ncbi:peptidylprolyl isomerase [Chondromyces apiculatus]|uniref:peptidylprolyl isomerase n=1 Tax=Chondromyces apiculatus DSM 436 TaxID=1192034 RepID=A0A017T0R8_9BACT|nr:peptidylprolyl isomerase [Chondromyces apiculatus]EYF02455.1 Peptidyl-prolyl cis-trans isomerase PpiD [Chondromyces apiculatus DSM 436]